MWDVSNVCHMFEPVTCLLPGASAWAIACVFYEKQQETATTCHIARGPCRDCCVSMQPVARHDVLSSKLHIHFRHADACVPTTHMQAGVIAGELDRFYKSVWIRQNDSDEDEDDDGAPQICMPGMHSEDESD